MTAAESRDRWDSLAAIHGLPAVADGVHIASVSDDEAYASYRHNGMFYRYSFRLSGRGDLVVKDAYMLRS